MFRDGLVRLLVFRVAGERFAVPLEDVHEVIDMPEVQRVPDASSAVIGVAALRDGYVSLFDAASLWGLSAAAPSSVLLFRRGERRMGLAVGDVLDAMTIEPSEVRAAPDPGADGTLVGLVWRGTELTAVMDTSALLDAVTALEEKAT